MIPDKHYVTLNNKRFVLYEGLIGAAHEKGLQGIDSDLTQIPNADNGNVALCKAVVRMEDGRSFSGLGDASPENVKNPRQQRLIAMCETRAKARALRDALGVGTTAFEELSDGEESSTPTSSQGNKATRKQLNYLEALVEDARENGVARFEEMTGKAISELTQAEASDWIARLSGGQSAKEEPAPTPISQGRQARSHRDDELTHGGVAIGRANELIDRIIKAGHKREEVAPYIWKASPEVFEKKWAEYQGKESG